MPQLPFFSISALVKVEEKAYQVGSAVATMHDRFHWYQYSRNAISTRALPKVITTVIDHLSDFLCRLTNLATSTNYICDCYHIIFRMNGCN